MTSAATNTFVVEGFALLGVSVLLVALRIKARWIMVGWKDFQLDDYLMVLAAVVYGLETGAAYMVAEWFHGLANNCMTDRQRANLSPDSDEYRWRVGGSKVQVVGWSLYVTTLWLLKACMAIFYARITGGLLYIRTRILISYASIAVTYVVVLIVILAGCHPIHKNWQIYPDPGNHCQPAVAKIHIYFTVLLNVTTDIYLMSVPIPIIITSRMKWREKAPLIVLFSGGLFVITAGILRCVGGANSAEEGASWGRRESFVAVAIGNLPMIYPLVRRIARKARSCVRQNISQSYPRYPLSDSASQYHNHPVTQSRDTERRHNVQELDP
ncbi:uncharacterized protein N7511_011506 [Penicillium nucicola]|uniref:uncharacterized protein n=1 Tax=Penicillium nucicola TaxID=1850975 RepID=UPI00254599EA|nr:uncharacterized protein N7511_011506 [Penicillium nucicola]KAJ5742487.1 hypothetical protein N7511_011506 [Penicillium nucicola]